MGLIVAEKVNVEANTSSPFSIPSIIKAKCIAEVPDDNAAQWSIPV